MKTKSLFQSLLVLTIVGLLTTSCYREDGEFSTLPLSDEEEVIDPVEDTTPGINDVRLTFQPPEINDGVVKFVGAMVSNPLEKELTYGFMWFKPEDPESVNNPEMLKIGSTEHVLTYSAEVDTIPYGTYYTACVFALDEETGEMTAAGEIAFIVPRPGADK